MANEKETIILDLKVDQGSAISELEKTKKSIIQLKQEQKDLNEAYKKGNVTLEEYASESVRLEAILKKQTATYGNVQKSVTGVQTQMDKLIKSNQQMSSTMSDAAKQINVAGVNIGSLTGKIASFANPVTAAIGAVTALGAAYARSSIGAKDLEVATAQLGFVVDTITDSFAGLFSSAEAGEGILTKILNTMLKFSAIGITDALGITSIIEDSKEGAAALEELNKIREQAGLIQAGINERMADNADLLADLSNTELTLNERLSKSETILDNIRRNANDLLDQKNKEIDAENKLLEIRKKAGGDTGDIETRINKLLSERSAILSNESRQRNRIQKQVESIQRIEQKRLEDEKKERQKRLEDEERIAREKRIAGVDAEFAKDDTLSVHSGVLPVGDLKKRLKQDLEIREKYLDERDKKNKEFYENQKKQERDALEQTKNNFLALADLFSQGSEARKLFALAAIGTDTAEAISALTAASEKNPFNSTTFGAAGVAQFAAGIIRIIANMVAAKQFLDGGSFASGGYTGPGGKYQPAGIVHKGEVVWNQEDVAMAGGPRIVDMMRPTYRGYADGGVVTDAALKSTQIYQLANSLKNMPVPQVSVVEFNRVAKKLAIKESMTTS